MQRAAALLTHSAVNRNPKQMIAIVLISINSLYTHTRAREVRERACVSRAFEQQQQGLVLSIAVFKGAGERPMKESNHSEWINTIALIVISNDSSRAPGWTLNAAVAAVFSVAFIGKDTTME